MRRDAHVRVDIFYRNWCSARARWSKFSARSRTLPWVIVLAWMSWPDIRVSWTIMEGASQAGVLAFTYLLKSIVLVFCLVVGLQGLAVIARGILTLCGEGAARPG